MRFMLMMVAVLLVTACSSSDDAYLGSRDDIIVNNRGVPTAEKAVEATKETMKAEAAAKVEEAVTEVAVEPMDVTPMEPVAEAPKVEETAMVPHSLPDVPPNAQPGECYAKVLIPAVTDTKSERLQVSEEQKVLSRIIPAQYRVETEQVKVREARQYWKPGHGAVEKIDSATGEILCLVEEPALFKTVEKRVLVEPERPEYKVVPAKFETITSTYVVQPERLEWRRILCNTNVTPATIASIQRALLSKGYKVGPIDGQLGSKTMQAINSYQLNNGLASRGITYETLGHLGVPLATSL